MIPIETVAICAVVFFFAGVLELFAVPKDANEIRFARGLCALGFWAFSARLFYLVFTDDLSRLHFSSMSALMTICVGRIIICVGVLRYK